MREEKQSYGKIAQNITQAHQDQLLNERRGLCQALSYKLEVRSSRSACIQGTRAKVVFVAMLGSLGQGLKDYRRTAIVGAIPKASLS